MLDTPHAKVSVIFYNFEEHGRKNPVNLNTHYRPHFKVINDQEYLGVDFIEGPDGPVTPGKWISAKVSLIYYPDISYKELEVGAEFEILEGKNVVGKGKVIEIDI